MLIATVIAGVAKYRTITSFLKIFLLVLWAGLITTGFSEYYIYVLKRGNNSLVNNFFVLFETAFLLYAASLIFKSPAARFALLAAGITIGATWTFESYRDGMLNFNSYAYLAECACLLIIYVVVMYRAVLNTNTPLRSGIFWMSAGVVINAGCNIPFFCLFYYLQQYNITISQKLYLIIPVVASTQYLCCIVAFCLSKPPTQKISDGK